ALRPWLLGETGSVGGLVGVRIGLYIAGALLTAWASAATVLAVMAHREERAIELPNIVWEALALAPSVFLLSLVLTLLLGLTVGLPLFILTLIFLRVLPLLILFWIGGVVWGLFLTVRIILLSGVALVGERVGPTEAIGYAWEASRGIFWSLLELVIVFALAGLILDLLGRIPYLGVAIELLGQALGAHLLTAACAFIYGSARELETAI
ncbi:MAG: hypothetical protein ACUVQS_05740, partial [Candidatus Bipolaricaulaceae bacterium]